LNKIILAFGIIFLFIFSAVAPIAFGNNIFYTSENNKLMITNGCNNRGWSGTEEVSKGSPPSFNPSLMVDSLGNVHVVWYANRYGEGFWILYNYKTDSGSWNDPETIESGGLNEMSRCSPSLYVEDDGTVHVAWADTLDHAGSGNDYDILYKNRTNAGIWSNTEVVSTESTSNSEYPWIVVDNIGTVHVVWEDDSDYAGAGDDEDIFYKYKTAGGSWSNTEVVSTESTGTSWYPSLEVDNSGTLHVVWQDNTDYDGSGSDVDIIYKNKTVGSSWSNAEVVSTESIDSSCLSSIYVEDDTSVHIAWSDSSDYQSSGSDYDVFYKYKTPADSWSNTEVVSIESTEWSRSPSLIVDNIDTVHVTWDDATDYPGASDERDIFYKNKPNGGSWSNIEVVSTESIKDCSCPSMDVEDDGTVHVAWEDDTPFLNTKIYYKYRISQNQPPNKPSIDGPRIGIKGTEYDYIFNVLDPDWDDVRFIIDWGDDNSEITDFYPSCTDAIVSHI